MKQNILFENTFDRSHKEWDNKSFLKNTIETHPYFGLAYFFSLKNLDKNNANYTDAAAKTMLFFTNPYLLKVQLKESINVTTSVLDSNVKEELKSIVEENNVIENSSINQPLVSMKDDKTEEETQLFQPLFTSDYFASQGIKLSEQMLANDKLGNQLKSFTSWLKTMKKVHPDKLVQVNAALETAMQNLAAKSNRETEVITEAMAEVYIQQEKPLKAIEIYEKLSLTNPLKSAYFADKIYHLKK